MEQAKTLQQPAAADQRNYGVDLMRIVSMLMVLTLHVLGQGGVLNGTKLLTVNNEVAWLMEVAAYGAVDCFALISGFVGYGRRHRLSGLLQLYSQILFYTVGITLIFMAAAPELATVENLLQSTVPFAFNYYWYFTGYLGLYFFMPGLNLMIERMDRRQVKAMVIAILVLFTVIPAIFAKDVFRTYSGYSMVWLGIMYILGACIRKYDFGKAVPKTVWLAVYFGCTLLAWGARQGTEALTMHLYGEAKRYSALVSYISPTAVLGSAGLLLYFSRLRIQGIGKKLVAFFSPLAFSVYLIHLHPLIWKNVMKGLFREFASYEPLLMVLTVVGAVLGIWLVCSLIDAVRQQLFRLLRIRKLCDKIDTFLTSRILK